MSEHEQMETASPKPWEPEESDTAELHFPRAALPVWALRPALLQEPSPVPMARQMQQSLVFCNTSSADLKWCWAYKRTFCFVCLFVTTVDNYVGSKCPQRLLGFLFLGIGILKSFSSKLCFSVGLYHVFGNSRNLKKQLNYQCDIKM